MLKSPLCWVGGKSQLRRTIIDLLPEHACYVELFSGAGWVLFGKEPSKVEVLNDANDELVNFYRIVKEDVEGFLREFRYILLSRTLFKRLLGTPPAYLSDTARAARFYYVLKVSFGGAGRHFGTRTSGAGPLNLDALPGVAREVHHRLRAVIVECLDFERCVGVYDRPATVFYADPPYHGLESYYEYPFLPSDHERLAAALRAAQGRWLLSYNDVPEIRALYRGFTIEEVNVRYSRARYRQGRPLKSELLIRNF